MWEDDDQERISKLLKEADEFVAKYETDGSCEPPSPKKPAKASKANQELVRITGRLAELVEEFLFTRRGKTFYQSELTNYVQSKTICAPDSPGRCLRQLRAIGQVDVEVVDKRKSLYAVGR